MHWAAQRYRVWVITTRSRVRLYEWKKWKQLVPHVDALLRLSSAKAAIRSSQSLRGHSRWLGFGRMLWNEANNKKWTTKYLAQPGLRKQIEFWDTEIWAPDWNATYDQKRAPDVFVKVDNDVTGPDHEQGIVIAVHNRLASANKALIEDAVAAIRQLVPKAKVCTLTRPWGEYVCADGYSNPLSGKSSFLLARKGRK